MRRQGGGGRSSGVAASAPAGLAAGRSCIGVPEAFAGQARRAYRRSNFPTASMGARCTRGSAVRLRPDAARWSEGGNQLCRPAPPNGSLRPGYSRMPATLGTRGVGRDASGIRSPWAGSGDTDLRGGLENGRSAGSAPCPALTRTGARTTSGSDCVHVAPACGAAANMRDGVSSGGPVAGRTEPFMSLAAGGHRHGVLVRL